MALTTRGAIAGLIFISTSAFAEQQVSTEDEIREINERLESLEQFRMSLVTNCDYSDFENGVYPWVIHSVSGVWSMHINDGDWLTIKRSGSSGSKDQFEVLRNRDPADPWSRGTWTGMCAGVGSSQIYILTGEGINLGGCLHDVNLLRTPPHSQFERDFRIVSLGIGRPDEGQPDDICITHHNRGIGRHPGSAHGGSD